MPEFRMGSLDEPDDTQPSPDEDLWPGLTWTCHVCRAEDLASERARRLEEATRKEEEQ